MVVKETEIAKPVTEWLRDSKWEVYQEVESHPGGAGKRADIVAKMDSVLWAIEVKNSFSLKVLEQAMNWTKYAHCVSIAVPKKKGKWRSYKSSRRDFEAHLCKHFGIGLIEINVRKNFEIKETIQPKFRRKVLYKKLRALLKEEHKTWAEAGNAKGGYYTPFKATVRDLVMFVSDHKGCSMSELVKGVTHHYKTNSTARSCISKYILDGIIDEIETVREGKHIRVYLKGQAPKTPERPEQLILF